MAKDPDFFVRNVRSARRFWLDQRQVPAAGLTVCGGGWEVCGTAYTVRRSGFPWYAFELVAAGRGTLQLGPTQVALRPGTVFAYGPGIAQAIRADPAAPMRKFFLDCAGSDARAWFTAAGLAPGTIRQLPLPSTLAGILEALIDAGCAGGPGVAALTEALARAALLAIQYGAVDPGPADAAYATYLRCRRHLETHAEELPSLRAAAAACRVSDAYLCRLFRRFDRSSPWDLVRHRRLQRAAELLADPEQRVAAVARAVGYADAFHLSRAFTRRFGTSPREFRRLRVGRGAAAPPSLPLRLNDPAEA